MGIPAKLPSAGRHVGVFRIAYPIPSETFITEQVRALTRYTPLLVMKSRRARTDIRSISVSDTHGRFGEKLFTLRPRPHFFNDQDSLRGVSLLHAHFGPDGVMALPLARALCVPLIVTFHGYDATVVRTSARRARDFGWLRFRASERRLSRESAAVIAVSQFIRTRLVAKGYDSSKIIVHYIGTDTERFTPPPALQYRERIVLNVARHAEKKGIDTLIRAFHRVAHKHPPVSMLQVGAGHTTGKLQLLIEELGMTKRIKLLGVQPHDEVRRLMQRAEVFALTSQTAPDGDSEALGIVFNEASACGCAIIGTHHGGIPEAVLHGETGLLADEYDVDGTALHLDRLLGDRALAEKMGRRGREYVMEMFNIQKQTALLEQFYDRIVDEHESNVTSDT